mgnify:CR=1 FL=1
MARVAVTKRKSSKQLIAVTAGKLFSSIGVLFAVRVLKSYRHARTSASLPICFPASSDSFTHSRHSWLTFILHCVSFITMLEGLNPVSFVRLVPMPKEAADFAPAMLLDVECLAKIERIAEDDGFSGRVDTQFAVAGNELVGEIEFIAGVAAYTVE